MAARKQLKPDTREPFVSGIPSYLKRRPQVVWVSTLVLGPLFGIATAKSRKRADDPPKWLSANTKLLIINCIGASQNGAPAALNCFSRWTFGPATAKNEVKTWCGNVQCKQDLTPQRTR